MKRIITILLCVCICACRMNKKWDIRSMNVSKELQPPTNITMNLINQKDNVLTIEFKNNGNEINSNTIKYCYYVFLLF